MIRWKALVRDVIMIFILMRLSALVRDVIIIPALMGQGGFVARLAAGDAEEPAPLVADFVDFAFGIVGFTISGCLAKVNRFRHLVSVGIVVWIISTGAYSLVVYINAISSAVGNVVGYAGMSFIEIGIPLLIGWGLSYLFVKAPKTPAATDGQESEPVSIDINSPES